MGSAVRSWNTQHRILPSFHPTGRITVGLFGDSGSHRNDVGSSCRLQSQTRKRDQPRRSSRIWLLKSAGSRSTHNYIDAELSEWGEMGLVLDVDCAPRSRLNHRHRSQRWSRRLADLLRIIRRCVARLGASLQEILPLVAVKGPSAGSAEIK